LKEDSLLGTCRYLLKNLGISVNVLYRSTQFRNVQFKFGTLSLKSEASQILICSVCSKKGEKMPIKGQYHKKKLWVKAMGG